MQRPYRDQRIKRPTNTMNQSQVMKPNPSQKPNRSVSTTRQSQDPMNHGKKQSKSPSNRVDPSQVMKKPRPRAIMRGLPKIQRDEKPKKVPPSDDGIKNFLKEAKQPAEQIRQIIEVFQPPKSAQQQAAELKLKKIQKILGLQTSSSKKQSKNNNRYSIQCSGSKSMEPQERDGQLNEKISNNKSHLIKTEERPSFNHQTPQNNIASQTESKKTGKKFDCEEIRESLLRRYQLRETSYRKNLEESKKSVKNNSESWVKEEEQDDTRYNEDLLSPIPQIEIDHTSLPKSRRKSIIRNSHSSSQLSKQKPDNKSIRRKTVHFSSQKKITQRKSEYSSHRSNQKQPQNKSFNTLTQIFPSQRLKSSRKQ